MAYQRSTLISRSGYGGLGGLRRRRGGMGDVWDSITGAAGSVLSFWGKEQQAVGAQAQAAQSNRDLTAALAAQNGGISTETILIGGGLAVAAFFLLRKKD
jgi:hypothetical protein